MLNKSLKTSAVAISVFLGGSLLSSQASYAQSANVLSPSLIQQNVGTLNKSYKVSKAIKDILTLDELETLIQQTSMTDTIDTGTYTVFAPRDSAFWQLSSDEYSQVSQDYQLAKDILESHIVEGNVNAASLISEIKASDTATTTRTTLNGKILTFAMYGSYVQLTDAFGNVAEVTRADLDYKNGRIHIINAVMAPNNDELKADFS